MGWLTHWDDLIHGTIVFGAAVPFGVALLLGWMLPGRLWMAVAGALIVPVLWLFGWPSWPLNGSEDVMITGLAVATGLVAVKGVPNVAGAPRAIFWAAAWAVPGVLLYPAWLAAEGGITRRLLVAGAMGISITAWAAALEFMARESRDEGENTLRLTPATWVPPSIALAVLLQFGGSTRFAQCAGALAAATGGVCLLLTRGCGKAGLRPLAVLWGMLSGLLGWAGWLFAEIQIGLALALLLVPVAARAARRLPLPRRTEFHAQLWDALAAAAVAVLVIAAGWMKFSKGADSSGY